MGISTIMVTHTVGISGQSARLARGIYGNFCDSICAYCPTLLRNCTLHCLANIPDCVLHETYSLVRIPFLSRHHHGYISFADEVVKGKSAILVLTCHIYHKTNVCSYQSFQSFRVAISYLLAKFFLFLLCESA